MTAGSGDLAPLSVANRPATDISLAPIAGIRRRKLHPRCPGLTRLEATRVITGEAWMSMPRTGISLT